uniref:U-box domain-containing protein n=1 Tax=Alexandrium andersonii TaxID=327968 RepID=A0A7S2CD07_9DINO
MAGLRDLVQNAPKEFRCALDGKLLCDPVVSPGGVVFERSTLVRWLQKHGPTCPITGQALQADDCKRSPEIRKQVTEWVRGKGRQREPKKKNKGP